MLLLRVWSFNVLLKHAAYKNHSLRKIPKPINQHGNNTLWSPSKLEVTKLSLIFFLYCIRLARRGNNKPSVEALFPILETVGVSSRAALRTITIESQQHVNTLLANLIPASTSALGSEGDE